VTSPVVLYAVVLALYVADAKYKAALNVLPVPVVKLCVAVMSSLMKEVHIAWVFATIAPYSNDAASADSATDFFN
jgi:hypothetical protein